MNAAVVFLLASLCCGLASECGRRRGPRKAVFISKGTDALPYEFPWQVALKEDDELVCGGSILNEEWIVTAAHCFKYPDIFYTVFVGKHNRSGTDDWQEERTISQVRVHPSYRTDRDFYDVALVKLSSPLNFDKNRRIGPVCLPDVDDDFTGEMCTASGWGRTSPEGKRATILQKVDLPILSSSQCKEHWSEFRPECMICAGYSSGGIGTCEADSGGPLVCQRKDNSWVLAGITTGAIGRCGGYGAPTFFARVTAVLDWMKEEMEEDE